jgi:hypothetical protein
VARFSALHSVVRDEGEIKDWKWNGTDGVRAYRPDDVIARISPEKDSKLRWRLQCNRSTLIHNSASRLQKITQVVS